MLRLDGHSFGNAALSDQNIGRSYPGKLRLPVQPLVAWYRQLQHAVFTRIISRALLPSRVEVEHREEHKQTHNTVDFSS